MICPGKTYRRDEDDATHSHQFHQCEGMVIDENISLIKNNHLAHIEESISNLEKNQVKIFAILEERLPSKK